MATVFKNLKFKIPLIAQCSHKSDEIYTCEYILGEMHRKIRKNTSVYSRNKTMNKPRGFWYCLYKKNYVNAFYALE